MGVGAKRITFCLEEEQALLRDAAPPTDPLIDLLPDPYARYSLQALSLRAPRMGDLVSRLWDGVWSGVISNDGLAALRKGIQQNFAAPALPEAHQQAGRRRVSRGGFQRWVSAAPFAGNWYRLPEPVEAEELLEEREQAKARARLLLDRYGLLFRELLHTELPACQWSAIFRALRLMELSGEVLTGCFFDGIPGLQFIAHPAFRQLQRALPTKAVWWVNACDPASPCGLALDGLRGQFPKRLPSNLLVFRGGELVATVQRGGKELRFHTPADDPQLLDYFDPLHALLIRQFMPVPHLTVERINDEEPRNSPYLDALGLAFEIVSNYPRIYLSRRI
jgi:ATP-dependent Lhr-like helicase